MTNRKSSIANRHSAQCTIRNPVRFSHRGPLSGRATSVRLKPGRADSGIVFSGGIPARLANAFVEEHLVGLRAGPETVLAVEHLLAACYGLGIDNLQVEVIGGEVPFGDGSALPFVRILQAAGVRQLKAPRAVQSILAPVVVSRADGFLCALPFDAGCRTPDAKHIKPEVSGAGREASCVERQAAPGLSINCFIRFPSKAVGEQSLDFQLDRAGFVRELAPARTFGYWQEGTRLPGWLGRLGEVRDGMLLPVKPRFADEPVRHKALDLLGDLCLLGRRLNARVIAFKAGHQLHHEFLKELEDRWT
jgi:UDP-3-O-[3-hydroxymyristoyl] N-acetylglucosamine deacetylase